MTVLLDAGVAIYVAMAAALVVWLGIFAYLWRIDREAQALKRYLQERPEPTAHAQPRAHVETRTPQVNEEA
ncbi:MAG: CcmD family protein [Roseiflexaceae bacterium]|jgi:CcmD family protein